MPTHEHTFSSSWTYDDTYHCHTCIDSGYENLRIDEEAHFGGYHTTDSRAICVVCGAEYGSSLSINQWYDKSAGEIRKITNNC
ncbi:MAG: hypothetical protein IJQ67_04345 [Bacilli bacterium]|nr:hypothetical protein [Bacilli bacterium]